MAFPHYTILQPFNPAWAWSYSDSPPQPRLEEERKPVAKDGFANGVRSFRKWCRKKSHLPVFAPLFERKVQWLKKVNAPSCRLRATSIVVPAAGCSW